MTTKTRKYEVTAAFSVNRKLTKRELDGIVHAIAVQVEEPWDQRKDQRCTYKVGSIKIVTKHEGCKITERGNK